LLATKSADAKSHLAFTVMVIAAAGASAIQPCALAAASILSIFSQYCGAGGRDYHIASMHAFPVRRTHLSAAMTMTRSIVTFQSLAWE